MLKSTEEGVMETGRVLPPLSEEDLKTILKMFAEYQEFGFLSKEDGVWRYDGHSIVK